MKKLLAIAIILVSFPAFAQVQRMTDATNLNVTVDGTTESRSLAEMFGDVVNVVNFGADRTGVADSSAAITAANDYATTNSRPLFFPSGTYKVGTESYDIDTRYTTWSGTGNVYLQWTAAPTDGYAVRIKSSGQDYYTASPKKTKNALNGITLLGGASAGSVFTATGLEFYGTSSHILHFAEVTNVVVRGFSTAINFTNNVWAISARRLMTYWGAIVSPATYDNFGESMDFHDCFFADATSYAFTMNHSIWRFFGTSFDNMPVVVNGHTNMYCGGCHFENPASSNTTYKYLTVNNDAHVVLDGPSILHNTPTTGPRTETLFSVNTTTGKTGGLFMNGARWGNFSLGTNYNTLTAANHYSLSDGTGYISVKNSSINAFENYQFISIGVGANKVQNRGFEGTGSGSVTGWITGLSGGGTGTLTASTALVKTGTYSGLSEVTYSGSTTTHTIKTSRVAVDANDIVLGGIWIKRDFTSGTGTFGIALRFYDYNNVELSAHNYSSGTTTSSDFYYNNFGAVAPAGAAHAQIVISNSVTSGTVLIYIDEAMLNVIDN